MLEIDNFPLNTIKGKICTQTIIHEFENGDINIELSIKPKCAMFGLGNLSFKCHYCQATGTGTGPGPGIGDWRLRLW